MCAIYNLFVYEQRNIFFFRNKNYYIQYIVWLQTGVNYFVIFRHVLSCYISSRFIMLYFIMFCFISSCLCQLVQKRNKHVNSWKLYIYFAFNIFTIFQKKKKKKFPRHFNSLAISNSSPFQFI